MANKKSNKKTTTKAKATNKAAKASAKDGRGMTVRECMEQSKILKMHMTVITVLSVIVCLLVVALIFAVKD